MLVCKISLGRDLISIEKLFFTFRTSSYSLIVIKGPLVVWYVLFIKPTGDNKNLAM